MLRPVRPCGGFDQTVNLGFMRSAVAPRQGWQPKEIRRPGSFD